MGSGAVEDAAKTIGRKSSEKPPPPPPPPPPPQKQKKKDKKSEFFCVPLTTPPGRLCSVRGIAQRGDSDLPMTIRFRGRLIGARGRSSGYDDGLNLATRLQGPKARPRVPRHYQHKTTACVAPQSDDSESRRGFTCGRSCARLQRI